MRLDGKVIIVTGSTTGIGEVIARHCVAEGAKVLIHGLERDLGEAVVAELGESAALHVDDLVDGDAPQRLVDAAMKAFGRIDGLVNNAAWVISSTLYSTSATFFDKVMAVNVRAPILLIQAALPQLSAARGSVVNIGSVNAYAGEPTLFDYSVSKGALMTMTRNLGDTLHQERGIRVNQINPGWVFTPGEFEKRKLEGMPVDWPSRVPKQYAPAGQLLDSSVIAAQAIFFLGDESYPVSGSVIELEQYPVIGRNPEKTIL